jgi:hypothetical protein
LEWGENAPFVFETVSELEYLDLDFALAVVLEDFFVGFSMSLF